MKTLLLFALLTLAVQGREMSFENWTGEEIGLAEGDGITATPPRLYRIAPGLRIDIETTNTVALFRTNGVPVSVHAPASWPAGERLRWLVHSDGLTWWVNVTGSRTVVETFWLAFKMGFGFACVGVMFRLIRSTSGTSPEL